MVVTTNYDTSTINIGASIAHSGACMTVIEKGKNWYSIDVSDESISKSTMGQWSKGTRVNLERPLTGSSEMGGHLVTGHVDAVASVTSISEIAGSHKISFIVPDEISFGIAPKGSITIDGISLTINNVQNNIFDVNIIPHTWNVTTIKDLQLGMKVNIEIDLIARYLARYFENKKA
jgi:riboflavin synthase